MSAGSIESIGAITDWNLVFFQVLGFTLGSFFLCFKFLPKIVRVSFFIVSFVFLSSVSSSYLAVFLSYLTDSTSQNLTDFFQLFSHSKLDILSHFSYGLGFSVIFSLAAYSCLIFSRWLVCFVFSTAGDNQSFYFAREEKSSLFNLIVLIFLVILFSTDMVVEMFSLLGEFSHASTSFNSQSTLTQVILVGSKALQFAIFLVIPILVASFSVDFLSIFWVRYFEESYSESLARSAKIPLLIIALSIMLIPLSEQISDIVANTIRAEKVLKIFR